MHRRSISLHLLSLAVLTLAGAGALGATSYVLVPDERLAEQAELVGRFEVLEVTAGRETGPITTDYRLLLRELVTGRAPAGPLLLRVLGGQLEDGSALQVWGLPRFEVGDRLFLFLRRRDDGSYRLLHLMQGAFRELEHRGETLIVRGLAEALQLPAATARVPGETADGADEAATARHLERFSAWLRDRELGLERPADYRLPAPPELLPAYTLLGDSVGRRIRWYEFDAGGQIAWHRHQSGQRGLADGGAAAFATALEAWNADPDTPVRYVDAGTTAATGAFATSDGVNTLLFDDLGDTIEGDFSCDGGGTVAVGGVSFVRAEDRVWGGLIFEPALEAEIVINRGVECYFRDRPDRAEEAYAHEVGHTLGLGHSCGDGFSPPCFNRPEQDQALMRASLHNDGRGALLTRDDRAGLRYLYDESFDGQSCARPPGHPRFCTECGPCGAEEGDCDGDGECLPGLACARRRGADFGFARNVDVCLDADEVNGECPRPFGDRRYCRECGPCAAGEGGCRKDRDCADGLVCERRAGDDFGFAPNVGVCVAAVDDCAFELGDRRYCARCGPCRLGEGGCRNDGECGGLLTCVERAGADFGLPPATAVCR